jgi:hypothetical protein
MTGAHQSKEDRVARLEAQLAALTDAEPSVSSTAVGVDALQTALSEKQKELQSLRLRSEFASVLELRLEAQQSLTRAVALQRMLLVQPAAPRSLRPHQQRRDALLDASVQAQQEAEAFELRRGRGWTALVESPALAVTLPKSLASLAGGLDAALALIDAAMAEEQRPPDDGRAKEEAATRELQQRKRELQKTRLREQRSRAPVATALAAPGGLGASVLAAEINQLRQERSRLTEAVTALKAQRLAPPILAGDSSLR